MLTVGILSGLLVNFLFARQDVKADKVMYWCIPLLFLWVIVYSVFVAHYWGFFKDHSSGPDVPEINRLLSVVLFTLSTLLIASVVRMFRTAAKKGF